MNDTVKIKKIDSFKTDANVPVSKSWGNRLLALGSVCPDRFTINNLPTSSDVVTMISCLKEIGLEVDLSESKIVINNSFPLCEKSSSDSVILNSGDGGTTNRFLIPVLAKGKNKYQLKTEHEMSERPMEELFRVIRLLGANASVIGREFHVQGPSGVSDETIDVDCSETTQFLTGLCIAYIDEGATFNPIHLESSKNYWELTRNILSDYKKGRREFTIPIDFSSASYPLALAAALGEVKITGCSEIDHLQADSILIPILQEMGAAVSFTDNSISISKANKLSPIAKECSSFPDLVPTLVYLCVMANGKSELSGLEVLRHKESDRVSGILELLELYEIDYTFDNESHTLTISGGTARNKEVTYTPATDHRMVMMAAMFMASFGGGVLGNAHCVSKSFPSFFDLLEFD
jgi:3-phosphoshikimate 1-carboxyvinyltransferase